MIDNDWDLDKLHTTIIQLHEHGVGRDKGQGYSTAFLSLLLGEAQLSDGDTCIVYVAETDVDAAHMRERFVRQVAAEPGLVIWRHTYQQIGIYPKRQVFFFVGAEYMAQRFSFLGTRIDKLFLDMPDFMLGKILRDKLTLLSDRGTEIIG